MPKISYNFKIPADQFENFRSDISAAGAAFQLDHLVKFDAENKTVSFACDASVIEMFFAKDLRGKYDFFPADYKTCERFENDQPLSFLDSRRQELARYHALEANQPQARIPGSDLLSNCDDQNIIISEYHPDPYPKRILSALLNHPFDKKPTIVLERLPASLNEELEKWLQTPDAPLPKSIEYYCQFVDEQNFAEAKRSLPDLSAEDQDLLKNFTAQFLHEAKEKGFPVLFFESEHSRVGDVRREVGGGRHECLVASLHQLKSEHPDENFITFAGAYHDHPDLEKVTLSKAIAASPCLLMEKKMAQVFETESAKCRNQEDGKLYLKMAQQIDECGVDVPEAGAREAETAALKANPVQVAAK